MTPHDFYSLLDGYNFHEDREMDKLAWLASIIIAPHVKHPPTPAQLRGKLEAITEREHIASFAKAKIGKRG
jgi:hypothetical protein